MTHPPEHFIVWSVFHLGAYIALCSVSPYVTHRCYTCTQKHNIWHTAASLCSNESDSACLNSIRWVHFCVLFWHSLLSPSPRDTTQYHQSLRGNDARYKREWEERVRENEIHMGRRDGREKREIDRWEDKVREMIWRNHCTVGQKTIFLFALFSALSHSLHIISPHLLLAAPDKRERKI